MAGEVIGTVAWKYEEHDDRPREGLGFAIATSTLLDAFLELKNVQPAPPPTRRAQPTSTPRSNTEPTPTHSTVPSGGKVFPADASIMATLEALLPKGMEWDWVKNEMGFSTEGISHGFNPPTVAAWHIGGIVEIHQTCLRTWSRS